MIAQLFLNSLIASSIYILVAISYSLIYSVTPFFNFSMAIIFTSGAYATYYLHMLLHLPLIIALPLAIFLSSFLNCFLEYSIYRPLRRRNASPMILLLSSIGIYIILQNFISVTFGDGIQTIRSDIIKEGMMCLGARITKVQLITIVTSFVLSGCLFGWLRASKIGKFIRALSCNSTLATISGINTDKVIFQTYGLAAAIMSLAGALFAFDLDMYPTMGMNGLLLGVVAVIVGGVGSIPGVSLGALLLGFAQHFGIWNIGSQWQDAIAFIILFIFLLIRPHGVHGKRDIKVQI